MSANMATRRHWEVDRVLEGTEVLSLLIKRHMDLDRSALEEIARRLSERRRTSSWLVCRERTTSGTHEGGLYDR